MTLLRVSLTTPLKLRFMALLRLPITTLPGCPSPLCPGFRSATAAAHHQLCSRYILREYDFLEVLITQLHKRAFLELPIMGLLTGSKDTIHHPHAKHRHSCKVLGTQIARCLLLNLLVSDHNFLTPALVESAQARNILAGPAPNLDSSAFAIQNDWLQILQAILDVCLREFASRGARSNCCAINQDRRSVKRSWLSCWSSLVCNDALEGTIGTMDTHARRPSEAYIHVYSWPPQCPL